MEKTIFVMLRTQAGGFTPLMTESGELAMFETVEEAYRATKDNPLAQAFGATWFDDGLDGEELV